MYKERTGISKSDPIDACLSVDAIYFTPDVSVTDESIFTGIQFDETREALISPNIFKKFSKDIKEK